MRQRSITVHIGRISIALGASWLLAAPLGLGAIATLYVPIMAPSLGRIEAWSVALGIALLVGVSLLSHALAHAWTARATGSQAPSSIPLYLSGDAAQVWPAAPTPWREVLVAVAGPTANLLLAGLAYLIWNSQLHPYLNVSTLFLAVVNVGLATVNLAPGFPLDGGRLARSIVWGLLERPAQMNRLGIWLGRLIAAALTVWGITLIVRRARFSLETGAGTLFAAALLLLALWKQPAREWDRSVTSRRASSRGGLIRGVVAGLLILGLLGVTFSLVPTVNGLQAPGFAIAVEPMVSVAPEYRHTYAGSFILTSVFSQTPIVAGQWVYGQLSPVVEIVPPEHVVPPDITPQELMERNYRLLEESETMATVVALRLAGYDVHVAGEAVEVDSILPESPARGVLQPGDHIVSLNGEPIKTASELVDRIRAQNPDDTVDLRIERAGRRMQLTLPLMQPPDPDEPPQLGVAVRTVGSDAEFPFSIEVKPQKIAGGPSAGLMFTLTIYNLITPEDLTGGRRIAGTGTINLDGEVGPIGGVEQKVASAERAGAEYFLAPSENYADARRVAQHIRVVEAATAEEAIEFLRGLLAVEDR